MVTTASPANFDLVKSRGADVVFDYHDPECANKIKAYTNNELHHVLDTIATEASFKICAAALPSESTQKLKVAALLPTDTWPRKDVDATAILGYSTFGEPFSKFGRDFPAFKENFDYGKMFWRLSGQLLAQGKIKTHPVSLRAGGLRGIPSG